MTTLNRRAFLSLACAVVAAAGCVRHRRAVGGLPPNTPLERIAVPAAVGAGTPSTPPCAQRMRDTASGREYLLLQAQVLERVSRVGDTTTTSLEQAVGDYAPIDPGAPRARRSGSGSVRVRVDCTTSRVLYSGSAGA